MSSMFRGPLFWATAAMAATVALSNFAVQFPINEWLTWGAFTFPVAFLVTDLTNRTLGSVMARRVVVRGFAVAVLLSLLVSSPRIALASGTAFLVGQLLDVHVFDRLRRGSWWRAPLVSSAVASMVDSFLFFGLAFAGTGLSWETWALGDLAVKMVAAFFLLLPFRLLTGAMERSAGSTLARSER